MFFKATDRHALLHKKSYHPKHTFRGLVKSRLILFNRICTYPEDVEEATKTLFGALRPRGYSKRFLRSTKAEVNGALLLNNAPVAPQTNSTLLPLVITHSVSTKPFIKKSDQTF